MSSLHGVLLLAFGGTCVGIIALSLRHRIGAIQYPFLAASVMLGWVFPQLVGLAVMDLAPEEAITKTIVFATFCLVAGTVGYRSTRSPARLLQWQLSQDRLNLAAGCLALLGAYFFFKVTKLAAETMSLHGGFWTGPITIYVFFSGMLTVGMVVALVTYINSPNRLSLAIVLFGLAFLLHRVAVQGRREEMIELFTLGMLFLWLRRGWVPPRLLVVGVVTFGLFMANSIGDYRKLMLKTEGEFGWSGAGVSDLAQIEWIDNYLAALEEPEKTAELLNAALVIESADRQLTFDFGLSHWNNFVHAYIPAQLLGSEFKKSLRFPLDNVVQREFGHVALPGSTFTGLADAFGSFWWFGCAVFLVIGVILKRWFIAASLGNPAAQMMVMLLTPKSLLAITHETSQFFLEFISLAAFLGPALLFAGRSVKPESAGGPGSRPTEWARP